MITGDVKKWKSDFIRRNRWNDTKQRRVQELEAAVVLRWLLDFKLDQYNILEVGCGNGHFGSIVATGLLNKGKKFSYHFSDLLPECVELAKENTKDISGLADISYSALDLFDFDNNQANSLGPYDVVLSTGFVSAATYKDAVPLVSNLLKPGGVLIADFVNHLSPVIFLSQPILMV